MRGMLNGGKRFNLPLEFRNILLMQVLIQVPSSHGLGIGADVTHGSIIMKFSIDFDEQNNARSPIDIPNH